LFSRVLEAPSELAGSFIGILFFRTVGHQVSELVSQPITKRCVDITVGVDEDGPAGQVSEHGAGVTGGHMKVKDASVVAVPSRDRTQRTHRRAGASPTGTAFALQGDTAKARAAYEDFLTLWKDADPDIPIFKQAKAEYAKLP
jgi:hypothetical protein